MNDAFQIRVHAAAVAGWWTFLVASAFLTIQWVAYLGVMAAQPPWALSFWGPGQTWESVRTVWFQALVSAKLTLWLLGLAALWLTLWERQLRRPSLRA